MGWKCAECASCSMDSERINTLFCILGEMVIPSIPYFRSFLAIGLIGAFIGAYAFFHSAPVDFNTEVKPILNKKCISCHGGVKQKAGFSLLFQEEAFGPTESGKPAIIPGDPDGSEMIRRLTLHDPEERMPYKEEPLSADEISVLKRWIREGARWGKHWAYEPVKAVSPPSLPRKFGIFPSPYRHQVKNDIDHFIIERLDGKGLQPSPQAEKEILLRRAALDLIGMPAPEDIAQKYLSDTSSGAYETLLDTLLAHPGYGEKWTSMWLDLARYADTKGYERDDVRSIWRYRDWLIKSFNEDKPYNEFITEQIAGDLLPEATDEQLIATAFHRNTMTNDEGGTDNEEYRTAAVLDRVNTTWEVLMGTTFACVQCHSHPYDPFTHEEYYKFTAFFNNTRDEDSYHDYPLLHEYRGTDSTRFEELKKWAASNLARDEAASVIKFLKTKQPAINSLTSDNFVNAELADTKFLALRNHAQARFRNIELTGRSRLLFRFGSYQEDGRLKIHVDSLRGPLLTSFIVPKANYWAVHEVPLNSFNGRHDLYFTYSSNGLKKEQNGMHFDWLYFTNPFPGMDKPGYDSARKNFIRLVSSEDAIRTPIMVENPPYMRRQTFLFERGNWLAKTKPVDAGVPSSLHSFPKDAPRNRLGLANWITDKANPLTARTIVNRIWEQLFGQGLVETLEDMGSQGSAPSHRELLDHLSYRLMNEHGWSLKKLIREIMLSATYRQDSKVTEEGLQKDRFNRWYARGPRVRLSAEQVRDQALQVSGSLHARMFGPSSKPWQPEGIWNSPYSGGEKWDNELGPERFRRAVYTYWKRTSAYPSLLNFDAMQREVCISRRIRTNTPLQALTLLNDEAYLQISRQFAFRLLKENRDTEASISFAYQRATGRVVPMEVLKELKKLYHESLEKFSKNQDMTCEMVGLQDEHNNPKTAAMIVVVHSIMNLDEVITKS